MIAILIDLILSEKSQEAYLFTLTLSARAHTLLVPRNKFHRPHTCG